MLLIIKPVRTSDFALTCLEGVIASVVNYWGKEYRLLFLASWVFRYVPFNENRDLKFGERLECENHDKILTIVEKYMGTKVQICNSDNMKLIHSLIESEIEKNCPISLCMDSYWSYWHPMYMKEHVKHFFLVIGVNENDGSLTCIDPFCADESFVLNLDEIMDHIDGYLTFNKLIDHNATFDWVEGIKDAINELSNDISVKETFDKMRILAVDIVNHLDFEEEIMGNNTILTVKLFVEFDALHLRRKKFANILIYMSQYCVQLQDIAERVEYAASIWNYIKALITKAFYAKGSKLKTGVIAEKIRYLADLEESIAHELVMNIESSNLYKE